MKNLLLFTFLLGLLYFYFSYPKILRQVPRADKTGIVKDIKNIKIKNIKNPVNASIENYNDNYIVAFRINENRSSYIGISLLNKDFEEINNYKKINVKSKTAEDPRIFKHLDNYFLIYNDKLPIKHDCRAMHIAKMDENFKISYKTALDLHISTKEKNWTPFIFKDQIHLAYNLMPHKIMQLTNPSVNNLNHLIFPDNPCFSRFFWKWGSPRGGTPAKLVDGNYLSFFHSCFGKNKNKKFYVMGAYIFQKDPPHKIIKVSKFPLIFDSPRKTRIYFPMGFVIKKENNKDLIYLSYGENDNISKIAIIDKEKLFENMKDVD